MGMREYETIYIMKSDITEDIFDRVTGRLQRAMEDNRGTLLAKDNWGKRKLAYDIEKQAKGHFVLLHYLGNGAVVSELERQLKIDDAVIRFMTVKLDEDVDAEARIKAVAEAPRQSLAPIDDEPPQRRGGGRHHSRIQDMDDEDGDDE